MTDIRILEEYFEKPSKDDGFFKNKRTIFLCQKFWIIIKKCFRNVIKRTKNRIFENILKNVLAKKNEDFL